MELLDGCGRARAAVVRACQASSIPGPGARADAALLLHRRQALLVCLYQLVDQDVDVCYRSAKSWIFSI